MTRREPQSSLVTLCINPEEHWTLHHVLLDRIDHEAAADTGGDDPPQIEVYQAFETLEDGETVFTVDQLKAIRSVLAEYHHSTTWWEIERPRLEELLHRITDRLERLEQEQQTSCVK